MNPECDALSGSEAASVHFHARAAPGAVGGKRDGGGLGAAASLRIHRVVRPVVSNPWKPIDRAKLTVRQGGAIVKSVQSERSGFYVIDGLQPLTTYTMQVSKTGFISRNTTLTTGAAGSILDITPLHMAYKRTPEDPFEEMLVTLEWLSVFPRSPKCSEPFGSYMIYVRGEDPGCNPLENRGAERP